MTGTVELFTEFPLLFNNCFIAQRKQIYEELSAFCIISFICHFQNKNDGSMTCMEFIQWIDC